LLRNLAVTNPFRNQDDDLIFSWSKQDLSLGIDDAPRRWRF
jgi:hypothetical protein